MATDEWKKVELGTTWNLKEAKKDDELIGLYIGKEENVGENNSNIYNFERLDNNENIAVWGSTVLDTRMKNVKVGEEVKIVYKGTKPSPNRKDKVYHDFDVFHRKPAFVNASEEKFKDDVEAALKK